MQPTDCAVRAIFDSAIEAILTIQENGCITAFNRAAERMFGVAAASVIGKSVIETLVPPRIRGTVRQQLVDYVQTGENPAIGQYIELPLMRSDGREFPAELAVTLASSDDDLIVTCFVRDITDRVEIEAARQRQVEERLAVYELSEAVSRTSCIAQVNEIATAALQRLLGASRAAVLLFDDQGTMKFVAWRNLSDDYRGVAEGHSPWSAEETNPQPIMVQDVATDDSLQELRTTIMDEGIRSLAFIPLLYESTLLGKFMVYYDEPHAYTESEVRLAQTIANYVAFAIVGHRRAQASESQRSFLRQVLDINPNLIFVKDREGRFTLTNQAVADIYGTTIDQLVGKTDADFNPNHDEVEHFRQVDLKVMDSLKEDVCEEVITDAHGEHHWLQTVKRPVLGPDGKATHVLGVAVDMTARKQTEDELRRHREHLEEIIAERTRELEVSHEHLRQKERMAMIGTLSTGLGHDMGNLLLPLRVRLDAMEARGMTPELAEDVHALRTFAEYLQRLSNGLRLLALDPNEPGYVHDSTDVQEWWLDVQPVLKNILPRGITLKGECEANLPRASVPRHILTQVVFNLVQNAGDAMRERARGEIRVWAARGELSDQIRFGVTDDGPGMTQDVARRCMEPFFTTKVRSISTGLGLALVHGLVQAAGGVINLKTRPGGGTTFTLDFQASSDGGAGSGMETKRLCAVVSLQDARMRSHVTSVMRSLGFNVLATKLGETGSCDIDVWVVDAKPPILTQAQEFISSGEHRHVIVFGALPQGSEIVRVMELPEKPKPSEIWRAIRNVLHRFELVSKGVPA